MSIAERGVALLARIRLRMSANTSPEALSERGSTGGRFPEDHDPAGHQATPRAARPRSARDAGHEPGTGGSGTAGSRWVLAVVSVAWFLVLINDTAVTVALPPLGRELGLGLAGLEWVVNLYTLTFAVLTLWGGMLADRLGSRPVFLAGLVIFAISSLAAGLSPDGGALIGLRAAQGAGAALIGPAALALLTTSFTGRARPLALGVWSGVGAAALAGGPLVGALLTSGLGWRSIFWINAPLGVLVWFVARRTLPAPLPAARTGRIDFAGGLASAVGLSALIYALTQANAYGWTSVGLWVLLVAATAAFALFWLIERRAAAPLLKPSLLRRPNFLPGNLLGMASLAVMCSVFFFLSLYLQLAAGDTALRAGLALLPLTLLGAAAAPVAGWLVPRLGARTLIAAGMALTAVGLVLLAGITPGWGALQLQPGLLVTGLGIGLSTAPITTATLGHIPDHHMGVASATLNAFRMIGLSLGIAVMGAIVAAQWPGDLARTRPTGTAFTDGIADGLLINAAIAAAAGVLAIAALHTTPTPDDDRAAAPAAQRQEGVERR
ncbi:MFS transporter [Streptomyces albogriseolus]|uniref:Drug resistance transporter, EmrB/QacA subfamily n=2 Tax=unclassified Streptomyces TaxID=2593676 RepID=V9Z5R3_9ACTN|nr:MULTISPECIES: MFS transporter [unclassified Streptomyces]AHE38969.1 Drug resistance transporter, emrB/qacA subfamily [Streptomyces sp. FR1]AHE39453.1 Drug resistance transporter, EmrB/QacA subfamily [Streptomyces sp. F2]